MTAARSSVQGTLLLSRDREGAVRPPLRRKLSLAERMSIGDFHTVCRVADLVDGEGKTVAVGNKLIAVFQANGEYFAIDDVCPHMGASLSGGYVENGIVTCPWHAWRFRLADGAWADNPRLKIGCYPLRLLGDEIQIQANGTLTCRK